MFMVSRSAIIRHPRGENLVKEKWAKFQVLHLLWGCVYLSDGSIYLSSVCIDQGI